jgi:hypothetical protein
MPVSLGTLTIAAMYLGTTAISGGYLGTTQVFGGSAFSPSSLFASSEQGVWYDPSDLTTLFTDTAGTAPVTTPGQTVALMLDKSKGLALGSELANQNFTTYANYGPLAFDTFTATTTSLALANATSKTTIASSPDTISVVSGKSYTISYAANVVSGGFTATIRNAAAGTSYASGPQITTSGTFSFVFTASVTENVVFQITATAGVANYTFSNISVKELAGNHATQATAASRPTFGVVPLGGRRNLLVYSEQFDVTTGGWTKEASTAPSSTATPAPVGTSAVNLLTDNATSARHIVYQSFSGVLSDSRTLSVYAKQNTLRYLVLSVTNQGDTNCYSAVFDLQAGSASATKVNGTATITANAPVAVGGGWYRCSISGTMGAGSGNFYPFIGTSDRADFSGALAQNNMPVYAGSSQSLYIWGAQLETGSTATAYQKVTTAFDVTETGVQSLSYLSFDGVDDFMVTPTITPGVDKAQVFAGVRKLSDVSAGIIAELSATAEANSGSLVIFRNTNRYGAKSRGSINTTQIDSANTFASPISNVLTLLGNIAGDLATLRVNGIQESQSTADQGTGNFLAYPLYIGRRGGTTTPLNGNLYSLITRFGANLDTTAITDTETWVAGKTGVTL